ncbi:hypothetical protein LC653_35985 [Nostoc sp. CHAB 5784]|uniref:hypothetical protein n=1 Tax=Nostoc mirabile TaxID=2907820 RepID=UPI001E52783F|nr:hypothetical protein [Nostoc mirabile]MCC5669115.1 hypothetical protein [Nostoc mirabile CHAB5784]
MMGRSLRVAPEYIEKVKSALGRNGYPSQQSLATDIGFSLSTVKSFLTGKPVDYLNFLELTKKLGFEWQDIVYKEPETELDDGFWECLRSLATNQTGGNLAFVLATPESPIDMAHNTGHSSPFFNIFGYTAYLEALTETEARELIASSPILFTDEDVEWILTESRRWPLLLQILCRERLFNLEEGENNDNWREEGLQQMKSFAHLLDS